MLNIFFIKIGKIILIAIYMSGKIVDIVFYQAYNMTIMFKVEK